MGQKVPKHFLDEEKKIVSIKVTFVRYQNLYVYPKYCKPLWELVCSQMIKSWVILYTFHVMYISGFWGKNAFKKKHEI